jgi:hypothetical protein
MLTDVKVNERMNNTCFFFPLLDRCILNKKVYIIMYICSFSVYAVDYQVGFIDGYFKENGLGEKFFRQRYLSLR